VNANPAWQRMAGDASTALAVAPDPLSAVADSVALQARVLAGEPVDLSGVLYHAPGDAKDYYYDISLRPLLASDGSVTGVLSALVDVTGRAELDRQKNEFLSIASHELKTPITSIKAYAQMALRQAGSGAADRLARSLGIVDQQADRLVGLIEELLDVSRLQEGQLPLHVEPFDLAALLRDVVETTRLGAPDFTIRLETPPGPVPVAADAGRIEQVAINLLQNAIKYSGESRQVAITLSCIGSEAVTAVRDYGVGIPVAQQAHVFERYFRASNVSARHYSGLGLGLYITHGIVERHGGRMWLDSAEGQGSTFYFALPLARE
jgi:signal transduction histidine kinase